MAIQSLGLLAHVDDFRGTRPDQVFRLLHGKGVVTVDDEDVRSRAFLARRDAILVGAPAESFARLLIRTRL